MSHRHLLLAESKIIFSEAHKQEHICIEARILKSIVSDYYKIRSRMVKVEMELKRKRKNEPAR